MADVNITATTRTEFGKGASRRLRRAGQTPAVLYGHGTDPVHLALPAQETFLALRQPNVLLRLTIEGQSKPVLALPKQVQRDAILPIIEHIDLLLVKAGEKVTVDVPLNFTGEAERGTLVNIDLNNLSVLAPATNIRPSSRSRSRACSPATRSSSPTSRSPTVSRLPLTARPWSSTSSSPP